MQLLRKIMAGVAMMATALAGTVPARAGIGDLLVAPTRIVLDGRRGTEIVLNNIGDDTATYRISVEIRRMTPDGRLVEVDDPNALEKAAQEMIFYAPRRVTLAPNEPQSIRIAARAPQGLADGEYRVHLLFRAVPPPSPAKADSGEKPSGVQIKLIPIYGVTIPVIVRLGNLSVKAAIANVRLEKNGDKQEVALDLIRDGSRSTFGEVRVFKAGIKDPIAVRKAIAVYTEVKDRKVTVPIEDDYRGSLQGPVTVQYIETADDGSEKLAEVQAVLR